MWGQYPGEKEITFPPFTCLESDGDPYVEYTNEGEVVVFPLKVPPTFPAAPLRSHLEPLPMIWFTRLTRLALNGDTIEKNLLS